MANDIRMTPRKGGNFHPLPMRDFVISHLTRAGEDYPANIHRAWIEELKFIAEQKGRKRPYHKPAYSSFIVNFNKLVTEGLVVFSGREERSTYPRAQANDKIPLRKYFRLAGPGGAAR